MPSLESSPSKTRRRPSEIVTPEVTLPAPGDSEDWKLPTPMTELTEEASQDLWWFYLYAIDHHNQLLGAWRRDACHDDYTRWLKQYLGDSDSELDGISPDQREPIYPPTDIREWIWESPWAYWARVQPSVDRLQRRLFPDMSPFPDRQLLLPPRPVRPTFVDDDDAQPGGSGTVAEDVDGGVPTVPDSDSSDYDSDYHRTPERVSEDESSQ